MLRWYMNAATDHLSRSVWMSYKLRFHELALDEWHKIDHSIREILKKKLAERLKMPCIIADHKELTPSCAQKVKWNF